MSYRKRRGSGSRCLDYQSPNQISLQSWTSPQSRVLFSRRRCASSRQINFTTALAFPTCAFSLLQVARRRCATSRQIKFHYSTRRFPHRPTTPFAPGSRGEGSRRRRGGGASSSISNIQAVRPTLSSA
jgi:hypothetical protein